MSRHHSRQRSYPSHPRRLNSNDARYPCGHGRDYSDPKLDLHQSYHHRPLGSPSPPPPLKSSPPRTRSAVEPQPSDAALSRSRRRASPCLRSADDCVQTVLGKNADPGLQGALGLGHLASLRDHYHHPPLHFQPASIDSSPSSSSSPCSSSPPSPSQVLLHPFKSGVIDECDKYNPLVLHHLRRQSIMQPVSVTHPRRGSAYSPSRHADPESQSSSTTRPRLALNEFRKHKQGLVYVQGSWRMTPKSEVATPKETTPASTSMSSTHAVASPITSRSSSLSSSSPSPLSPYITRDSHNSEERLNLQHEPERNPPINRRMSLPGQPASYSTVINRRMSCTHSSSPSLLDTIFQRVWNPQSFSSSSKSNSSLALSEENLKTIGLSDLAIRTEDGRNLSPRPAACPLGRRPGDELPPHSYPSSSSFTGSSESACTHNPRRASYRNEGHPPLNLFNQRFIHQITFSLDETHKSGLQAILALRKLTNGLSSVKPTTSSLTRVGGSSRSSPPNIPIPKISHRYPETNTIVRINGEQRTMIKKIVPSVVIDWSDGVQDEFDPTGMSREEILVRCHFY